MGRMTINILKNELSDFGQILSLKEGIVFTVFMRGNNLSKSNILTKVQGLILEYAGEKYPLIEVFVNDNDFLLAVLKPK